MNEKNQPESDKTRTEPKAVKDLNPSDEKAEDVTGGRTEVYAVKEPVDDRNPWNP